MHYHYLTVLLLLTATAFSQPQDSLQWVYPSKLLKHKSILSGNVHLLKDETNRTRLEGYIYERYDHNIGKFVEHHRRIFNFTSPYSTVLSWIQAENDTLMKDHFVFDNNPVNEDVLSILIPTTIHQQFYRKAGNANRAILSRESYEKQYGTWVMISRAADRVQLPFGYVYGTQYSLRAFCPVKYAFSTTGSSEGTLWTTQRDITIIDCAAENIKEEHREIRKLNEQEKQTYFSGLKKQGDQYVEEWLYTYAYDELSRLTQQNMKDVSGEVRYAFAYHRWGPVSTSRFIKKDDTWELTGRTEIVKEEEELGEKELELIRQSKKQEGWINTQREVYRYDPVGREVYAERSVWDTADQTWKNLETIKTKYHSGVLISEEISLYETDGYKVEAVYDDAMHLLESRTFICSGEACKADQWEPYFKAYYNDFNGGQTDYWRSELYENGKWERRDSIANTYNDQGFITELFYVNYDSDMQFRYKLLYGNPVTGVKDDEKEFSVYPNPVESLLKLTLPSSADFSVKLVSSQGHILMEAKNIRELDLSHLPPGVYLVLVETISGERFIKKILR